ncbi:MAG: hypothetical protein J6R88_05040 [Clostridia bacterium]|nr:hypothetical protein [Clostridia bacterium]
MTVTNKLKKFLILILSVIMALSLFVFTACDPEEETPDDDTTTPTEETSVTDYQALANGDFEFYTNEKTSYPYSSSIKWTRSNDKSNTSSITSTATSGIIDTSDDAYSKLTNKPTNNPRTPDYYGLVKNEYDAEDTAKRVNANTEGTKVLMINNKSSVARQGTAQKFTSSTTLTVPQNKYGVLTVWVKTSELDTIVVDKKSSKEYGAYVLITNSIGGNDLAPILVDNINTNEEWAQINLLVKGSEINSTSYIVTLGLGKGSKTNTDGYVEGYAFFDNLSFKTYTKEEYSAWTENGVINVTNDTTKATLTKNLKDLTYLDNGDKAEYNETTPKTYTKTEIKVAYPNGISYTSTDLTGSNFAFANIDEITNKPYDLTNGGLNTHVTSTAGELKTNAPAIFDSEKVKFNDFNDASVVNYIAFSKASSGTFKTKEFTVASDERKVITFYAQAKITNLSTKAVAKIQLQETGKDAVDVFANIKAGDEKGDFGYWNKYTVAVYNPTKNDVKFTLNMLLGIDKGVTSNMPSRDLAEGYAIIANVQDAVVSEEIYNLISSNNNSSKKTLYGDINNFDDSKDAHSHDEYSLSTDIAGQLEIQSKPVSVPEFNLVATDKTKVESGLVNSAYNDTYIANGYTFDVATLKTLTNLRSDKKTYNTNAQSLVLHNKELTNSALVSSKSTLSANSYTAIIVKLRVTGSAKANVYLSTTKYNLTTNKFDLLDITGDDDGENQIIKSGVVTATSHKANENWVEIRFYVATGNESIDYRVEIYNGDRDGGAGSVGTIFVDNVYIADFEADDFAKEKAQYVDEFNTLIKNETDATKKASYTFSSFEYKRVATVKYTNDDGEEAEKTREFPATEVYKGNDYIKFVSYETIHVDNVIDETTTEEEEETENEESNPYKDSLTQDLPLLIISGIIALALIIAIVVVIIKNNTKKRAKTAKKKEEYYSKDARSIAIKKILDKKSKINVEKDDFDTEYDYEEAARIGEENEEVVEEVIDLEELEKGNDVLNETDAEETDAE